MFEYTELFWILCLSQRLSNTGYYDWVLTYVGRVAKYAILKITFIGHLNIHGFINSNVLNTSSFKYTHSDIVIPRIFQFGSYGLHILFKFMHHFKTLNIGNINPEEYFGVHTYKKYLNLIISILIRNGCVNIRW